MNRDIAILKKYQVIDKLTCVYYVDGVRISKKEFNHLLNSGVITNEEYVKSNRSHSRIYTLNYNLVIDMKKQSQNYMTEEEFETLPSNKNILAGQEGPLRRPIFEGEYGEVQTFKGYEIVGVRCKSVYCKGDALWVKFENLETGEGYNIRIDNAYQQFKNTKAMTQDEVDKAEWMKARNKLESPEFVQRLIHQGKDLNYLMEVAGFREPTRI